ncbi:MAG: hypothetical protein ABSA72_02775 [Nitrososphaerales archaeon]|jgi:hypothetical protein
MEVTEALQHTLLLTSRRTGKTTTGPRKDVPVGAPHQLDVVVWLWAWRVAGGSAKATESAASAEEGLYVLDDCVGDLQNRGMNTKNCPNQRLMSFKGGEI